MRWLFLVGWAALLIAMGGLTSRAATEPLREKRAGTGREVVPADEFRPASPVLLEEGPEKARVEVPPPSEKALRYYYSGNLLWLSDVAWGLLLPCLFLFTGFSARIRAWATRLGRKWFFILVLYFLIFSILTYLLNFPLAYYQGFVRPHAYDLSDQTFAKWLGDSLKGLAVTLVGGSLFLWVPYLLLARSPKRWWLYTGLLMVPFVFLVMLITPIWIAPLFNQFHEMQNKELEAKILALARRAGIESSRVYEVNKSVDTKEMNAYVAGFLGTKRIVLWDTLLAKLTDQEILFVMGHEMGHYVLHHVEQGILFSAVLILVGLYGVHRTAGLFLRRFHDRFGFDRLADIASLPLLILLTNFFSLVLTPVGLAFSRHIEHEADRFSLEITRDNQAAAKSFVKFQTDDLGNPWPGPLYVWWRASHPPLGERIDFCNDYHPWEDGQPLRYGSYFREGER
ncbi:MAG: M48 family metallopeptidase [Planctomycetes bacterium]|nr:M48 family metallopeptidase [Planctomycetota bacterium]